MRLTDPMQSGRTASSVARACLRVGLTSSIEHPACHAEMFGRLSLVSTGTLEYLIDDAVLEIDQRFAQAKRQVDLSGVGRICRGGGWMGWVSNWLGGRALYIRREMLRFEGLARAKEDRPFDQVA